ncbi:oligopeptide transport system permease protein [Terribacillus aidingensis]|uniref:Oligopeptide transport system permease protein n=1 Tax=Terribacillus aidingensis TaxID=586416 RepID=A0A285P2B3_9BACI|nr:oligopeptide ABC transporter permease [Terribacillus aidingensis]SNZ14296.1 oligopeptide transport system permease protein [Terribacillus aidingensis]
MENKKQFDQDLFKRVDRTNEQSDNIVRESRTLLQDAFRSLRKNVFVMIAAVVLLVIVLMSIFAPIFSDYTTREQDLNKSLLGPRIPVLENISWLGLDGMETKTFNGNNVETAKQKALLQYKNNEDFISFDVVSEGNGTPNSAKVEATYDKYAASGFENEYFYFGTDRLGRDLWTRTWDGTRVSLLIAVVAALIDLVIGVLYGGIAAYYGGKVDNMMMRFLEIVIGIPNLVVVILMILILEPGLWAIIIALTITGWTSMARIVRGEILKLKGQEFVLAARTLGAPDKRIILRHLIPNVMGLIIVNTMFSIPSAIFFESFLSFIGLGLPSPAASLGTLINDGFAALQTTPSILVFPAVLISLIMIGFNILGDGVRDAFDPRLNKK